MFLIFIRLSNEKINEKPMEYFSEGMILNTV